MEPVRLILGVDGGGTGTVALLAQAESPDAAVAAEVIGRGESGPSNLRAVGEARCLAALDAAVRAAFLDAGLSKRPVAAACLGLAGADRPAEKRVLSDWARAFGLADQIRLENDAVTVLAAGTPAGVGLAIIAGTGSMALARSGDGQTDRAGGWGYLIGDEGSAYAVALAGLRRVVRGHDGRATPAAALAQRFLERLQADQVESIVPKLYGPGMDRSSIAAVARVVSGAAEDGDPVAIELIDNAGDELAEAGAAAARARFGPNVAAVAVAIAGGFVLSCERLERAMLQGLRRRGIEPSPSVRVVEPALGAVRLAHTMLS